MNALVNKRRGRRRQDSGLSLIEVVIAAGILLVVAVGILPLISRALASNVRGWEATEVSNHVKTRLEPFIQIDFDNAVLDIAVGSTTRSFTESWAAGDPAKVGDADEGWWPGTPTDKGTLFWTRNTRIRQFSVDDLTTPLGGGTPADFVHLKEAQVALRGSRQAGPLGAGQALTVRVLKAY